MSIARWLLIAAVITYAAIGMRVDAPAADSASGRCSPAPTVPAVTEGESLPGTVAPSVGTLRAILLLVHASDTPADESVDGPQEIFGQASAWFHDVSYGRLEFRPETLPRWLPLPETSRTYLADPARYLADSVAAADPFVDFSEFDVVYVAAAYRTPEAATSAVLNGFGVSADGRAVRFWVPFGPGFAQEVGEPQLLIHETGHLLGLPDLYTARAPVSFHRWDVMAARWPSELMAWHRWKLGWLDETQIVCVTGRTSRVVTIAPLEQEGGTKAVFVKRGNRILSFEVRARVGYDRSLCRPGVLVTEIDQTPFRRAPVRIHAARPNRGPPRCGSQWNAPFTTRRDIRTLRLSSWGLRLDVLAALPDGSYRVRIVTGS